MENSIELDVTGQLTRDAETRYTGTGKAVTSVGLAINTKSGEREFTQYVTVKIWNGRGEALAPHLTEGRQMRFRGRPAVELYEGKDGKTRADLVLHVNGNDLVGFGRKPSAQAEEPLAEPKPDESEIPF